MWLSSVSVTSLLLVSALLFLCGSAAVVDLNLSDFNQKVKKDTWLVEFYAPWCTHCQALKATWEELGENAKDFNVGRVDCVAEMEICEEQDISGYPTILLYSGNPTSETKTYKRATKFSGQRTLSSFQEFVERELTSQSAADSHDPDGEDDSAKEKEDGKKKHDKPKHQKKDQKKKEEAAAGGNKDELAPSAISLTKSNWDEVAKDSWFIEFYAPWCGYCKRLAPTYEEFAQNHDSAFKVGKVNCDVEHDICQENGIKGFPTLKFFHRGKVFDFSGQQTVEGMNEFGQGILEDSSLDGDGAVVVLTPKNFQRKVLSTPGSWMIEFYAPWCGHCKELAPDWANFAQQMNTNGDELHVAKVDCDAHTDFCSQFGITGYPSIKLLQIQDYPAEWARKPENFAAFWAKYDGVSQVIPANSDVITLSESNFYDKVSAGTWIVDFYAPWCGHCKQLAPVWEQLATQQKGNFFVAKVDCDQNNALCMEQGVQGFPAIFLFRDGEKHKDAYADAREVERLAAWVESFEEDDQALEDTDVIPLNDNFHERIASGSWIVEFYAPWCTHCRELAPTWDELAELENPGDRIKVAKVDCTKHTRLCNELQVPSYPTIILYKNGKPRPAFKGTRSLDKLQEYVNRHVPNESTSTNVKAQQKEII